MPNNYVGGWRRDREDWGALGGLQSEAEVLRLTGSYEEVTLDPREAMKVENQGSQGSCQGHAISSVVEWCYMLASGDIELQLSRAMGYYETQRLDRIRGDRGSTISGGVKLAKTQGICEERLWPYPRGYNPRRPESYGKVQENAKKYRIKNSFHLTTYQAVRNFLGSGQGGISIGISWGSSMKRSVVESFRPGSGGHAIGLFSLSDRKDNKDRPYVWMMNSWGSGFGNRGWSQWSPSAITQMMNHGFTVAVGLSDMPAITPREFSLDEWKEALKPC